MIENNDRHSVEKVGSKYGYIRKLGFCSSTKKLNPQLNDRELKEIDHELNKVIKKSFKENSTLKSLDGIMMLLNYLIDGLKQQVKI